MNKTKNCLECNSEFDARPNKKYCKASCRRSASKRRQKQGIRIREPSELWKKAVYVTKKHAAKSEMRRYVKDNIRNRKREVEFCLTEEEFRELIFSDCFYCGASPSIPLHSGRFFRNGIDRVDNELGYFYHNCIPACWTCNKMKSNLDVTSFLEHSKKIFKNSSKNTYFVNQDSLSLEDRVKLYNKSFPKYPFVWTDKGWLLGCWSIGNNYKNDTDYWGAFPRGFLYRLMSMFPDKKNILQLFSGSLPKGNYVRFDICNNDKADADVIGDAHKLSAHFEENSFDMIVADPPYSEEDAGYYGNPLVNRNKIVKECYKILDVGGHLCWLDMVLPMYSKKQFKRIGEIGITRSTNHRVRGLFIFQKVNHE